MNKHEYQDFLPEEADNVELIAHVQDIHRTMPQDEQALDRLRTRWYTMRQEAFSGSSTLSPKPEKTPVRRDLHKRSTALSTKGKTWLRPLNAIAAILIVCLLTGTFLVTISFLKQRTMTTVSQAKGTSGIWLGFSQTFTMLDEQVGWMMDHHLQTKEGYASVERTTDGGKHWQQVTPNLSPQKEYSWSLYVRDKLTAWLITRYDGERYAALYRTLDGGRTWQRFNWPYASVPLDFMTFTDQNHGWLLLVESPFVINLGDVRTGAYNSDADKGLQQFLLHTNDGGKSWQKIGPLPIAGRIEQVQFLDEHTGWITSETVTLKKGASLSQHTGYLYVTHDGGRTWQRQLLSATLAGIKPNAFLNLTFFNTQEGYLYAEYSDVDVNLHYYLYVTHDGGTSWQRSGNALPYKGLIIPPVEIPQQQVLPDSQHIVQYQVSQIPSQIEAITIFSLINGRWQQTQATFQRHNTTTLSIIQGFSFLSTQRGFVMIQAERGAENSTIQSMEVRRGRKWAAYHDQHIQTTLHHRLKQG
ncbi:hypothetical protein KSD_59390 [Ktedonobacter sp. SOSP1-85]|uniref:hypothetical protein n=1 Tax=Ktedonobacter sp. SOSP1-85 TaxID=2778367 RepID=UPI00191594A5|nr:hypothetical protein [Ktedonobacter sp. SOSP1-85]GHO78168.1 hypothetical protein KSD_59390 [Ktedonobacter sp. SOSP1-85]